LRHFSFGSEINKWNYKEKVEEEEKKN